MSALLSGPALAVYIFGGLWGLGLILVYLTDKIGIVLSLISLIFLPFIYYLTPLYAAFVDGYWMPLAVSYGSTVLAGLLGVLSQVLADEHG